jgi:hypothetical protein
MKTQRYMPTTHPGRARGVAWGGVALLAVGGLFVAVAGSAQAATSVGLGTADSFAVLAGSEITLTGPTTITGDVGLSPGTAFTGTGTLTLSGSQHLADAVAVQAKTDLVTAYNSAAAQTPPLTIYSAPGELAGLTLVPGVYKGASSLHLAGTLTLNALGDPNAAFVFQTTDSTLITASNSVVALINGAQACNVFWQVGSSATLGTNSTFVGTILASASISATTGARVDGRLLASSAAVTLDTNTITRSVCSTPPTGDTSGSTTAAYAANIGPNAQGLVCPWGGQLNAAGDLCVGTGANSLMNPPVVSTTPTPTSSTPTPTSSTPTPTSTTPTTTTPPVTVTSPVIARPPRAPVPAGGPVPAQQVPKKPSGGVGTGDNTTG